MKKKNIISITIISFISLMGILILNFTIFSKNDVLVNEESKTEEKIEEDVLTTIILTINPKVALEIDASGNIVNVYPLNDDAKIFKQEDFEGLNIEKGIEKVVEVAEDYLDKKPEITIASTEGEVKEIKNIESIFNSKGIKTKKIELDKEEEKEIKEQIKEEKENRDKDKKKTTTTVTTSIKTTKQTEVKTTKKKNEKTTRVVTTTKKNNETTKIKTTEKKSNNNYLKLLNVNKVNISFSKEIYNYEGIVNYDVSEVNINANAEDNNARVEGIEKKELVVGENNIVIKVIAEDGSERVYTIKITRRAMINLNDNKTYHYAYQTVNDEYVYPTSEECMGKMPHEINIPEGTTYNEHCKNTPPTNYPSIDSMGYYCVLNDAYNNSSAMTVNKLYECHYIIEFVDIDDVRKKADKIIKVGNYVGFAGGYGIHPEQITLDEEKCNKFNLSCGRW